MRTIGHHATNPAQLNQAECHRSTSHEPDCAIAAQVRLVREEPNKGGSNYRQAEDCRDDHQEKHTRKYRQRLFRRLPPALLPESTDDRGRHKEEEIDEKQNSARRDFVCDRIQPHLITAAKQFYDIPV